MQTQINMISQMAGACFIIIVNTVVFFYQWQTKPTNHKKFTVVSHHESEQFNITIIGFKSSPIYIQHQINKILQPHQKYAKTYIDDITIYSKIFKDYIVHLTAVFTALQEQKIILKLTKCFIVYPEASLLNNKINNFGTLIDKDCIKAISTLKFPKTLWQLKTYLGKTRYLHLSVLNYTQKTDVLQKLKTALLQKSSSFKDRVHKKFS